MKRVLGMTGMVLAVLGILISLAIIIGGWYGRGAINNSVAGMLPSIDNLLARESQQLERAGGALADVSGGIADTRARIQTIEGNVANVTSFVQDVKGAVDVVVGPIQNVRGELATLRSSLLTFASFYNGLTRFFDLPELPTDRLQAMDDRAQAVDQQIGSMQEDVNTTRQNIEETRAAITARLDNLQGTIAGLGEDATNYSTVLEDARVKLNRLAGKVNTYGTLMAIFLTIVGLCSTALFINLFHAGWLQWVTGKKDWIRKHTTITTTDVVTQPIESGERTVTTVTVTESEAREVIGEVEVVPAAS